ncbi:transmembrane protein 273 isoform X6 [Macaca nemestrina]|uniref:transmembrane protein 273 isoform X6 n=1 Tax=Macaca nemestrina TaxID=9545 RepID=UPI0039B87E00
MAHCACVARSQESGAEQSANMNLGVSMLRILFLLDVGGAQVLATGKPPGAEIVSDFKYALIGTAVGIAVSASFLALKICMIRRHLFDDDSSDLKSTPGGLNGEGCGAQAWLCPTKPGTEGHSVMLATARTNPQRRAQQAVKEGSDLSRHHPAKEESPKHGGGPSCSQEDVLEARTKTQAWCKALLERNHNFFERWFSSFPEMHR